MKQSDAAEVIEFPMEHTMENTYKMFAALAVVFLASLSSSSAFVKDLDTSKNFEKYFNHEQLQIFREKREEDTQKFFEKNDSAKSEEKLWESENIHNRREIGEEKETEEDQKDYKYDKKNEQEERTKNEEQKEKQKKPNIIKTGNETKSVQEDEASYRNMHTVIQALIFEDDEVFPEELQKMKETEEIMESEEFNNPSKRHSTRSTIISPQDLLGADFSEIIPLERLDAHSCETEALDYGHVHHAGVLTHEYFCEWRKFYHYMFICLRNLKSELSLGPLVTEEYNGDNIFGNFYPQILETIIKEPHHLLILPEIIRDAIPFTSILDASHRIKHCHSKLHHFAQEHLLTHFGHVLKHLLLHKHVGTHLRDKLHCSKLHHHHLHHLHHLRKLCDTLPDDILIEPILSPTVATETSTAYSEDVTTSQYYTSMEELLATFGGIAKGYFSSGIHYLITSGTKSISWPLVTSSLTSFLSTIPYASNYVPLQDTAVTKTSTINSVSTSVNSDSSSLIGILGGLNPLFENLHPVIEPLASIATNIKPVIAPEQVLPLISVPSPAPVAPNSPLLPAISSPIISNSVESTTVTETDTTSVSVPSPIAVVPNVVEEIVPEIDSPNVFTAPEVETEIASITSSVSSDIVSAPVGGVFVSSSESIVVPNDVEEIVPEIGAPETTEVSVSKSYVSSSDVISTPFNKLPFRLRPRFRQLVAPANSEAVSSSDFLIEPNQYKGLDLNIDSPVLPLIRSQIIQPIVPSPASVPSTVISSNSVTSNSARAISSLPGKFSFMLPREQIIGAIGNNNYLLPGDIIAVTLKNKSILCGYVQDATSPIAFNLVKPKMFASLLRNGGRVWNLLPRDFRDPECIRKFDDPLLLTAY